MKKLPLIAFLSALMALVACNATPSKQSDGLDSHSTQLMKDVDQHQKALQFETKKDKLAKAYFASGCFWCVEAIYESVNGVEEAISGYAGGDKNNPTYREVGTGLTGHAETVEVYYDPEKVDFETLVKVFFGSHDPTTLNRQGPDRGTAYRSIAFYQNDDEKKIIEAHIQELESNGTYAEGEIVTEVKEFEKFWIAEDYHQDYERNHPENPYVQNVSIPRLNRFKAKFPELLKENSH